MDTTTQARRQTTMPFDPNHDEKAAFAAHWVRDTVTRSSQTFDDATPNHDGVVRIFDPAKEARPQPGRRSAKAKPAPRFQLQITITLGGKL